MQGTWNHLLPFVTVMRERSFTRAARHLCITPAAVGQSIAQLERKLGVRLFHRTTRQLHPTYEARLMFEGMGSLVTDLDHQLKAIGDLNGEPSGLIRMSVAAAFGRKRIIPILPDFLDRHPRVNVEIYFDSLAGSLAQSGMDLAICHGTTDDGFIARPLVRMRLVLVASPDYVRRRGLPQSAEALNDHTFILSRTPDGMLFKWRWSGEPARAAPIVAAREDDRKGQVVIWGQLDVIREAALAGLGIGAIFSEYVVDDIASGALVQILPHAPIELDDPDKSVMFIQYPERAFLPVRVRALIDHIVSRIE